MLAIGKFSLLIGAKLFSFFHALNVIPFISARDEINITTPINA